MGSSSVTITNVEFESNYTNVTLTVKNTGTKTVTIYAVKVNNSPATMNGTLSLQPGLLGYIEVNCTWAPGNPYKFDLFDGSGQILGSYQATAPSS
jgi:hypothetical protein